MTGGKKGGGKNDEKVGVIIIPRTAAKPWANIFPSLLLPPCYLVADKMLKAR